MKVSWVVGILIMKVSVNSAVVNGRILRKIAVCKRHF